MRAAAEVERGGEEYGGVREEGEEGVKAVGGGGVMTAAEEELEVRGRERRRGGQSGGGGGGGRGGSGDSAGCGADEAVAGVGEVREHVRRGGGGGGVRARLGCGGRAAARERFRSPTVAPLLRGLGAEGSGGERRADGGRRACAFLEFLFIFFLRFYENKYWR